MPSVGTERVGIWTWYTCPVAHLCLKVKCGTQQAMYSLESGGWIAKVNSPRSNTSSVSIMMAHHAITLYNLLLLLSLYNKGSVGETNEA